MEYTKRIWHGRRGREGAGGGERGRGGHGKWKSGVWHSVSLSLCLSPGIMSGEMYHPTHLPAAVASILAARRSLQPSSGSYVVLETLPMTHDPTTFWPQVTYNHTPYSRLSFTATRTTLSLSFGCLLRSQWSQINMAHSDITLRSWWGALISCSADVYRPSDTPCKFS